MKKLKRIKAIVIAAAMAIAIGIPVAMGQSSDAGEGGRKEGRTFRGERGKRGGGHMKGGFFRGIDLTDAQKAQLKQIRENHRESLRPLMEELRAKRLEMRQASQGGTFNEALVSQKLAEIAPLEAKLMGEQFKLRQEMLSVLTPEQKTKLEQQREEFKSRWSERRARKTQKSA